MSNLHTSATVESYQQSEKNKVAMKTKTRQLHRNNVVTICNKGGKKLFLSYIKPEYTVPLLLKLCISTTNNATQLDFLK